MANESGPYKAGPSQGHPPTPKSSSPAMIRIRAQLDRTQWEQVDFESSENSFPHCVKRFIKNKIFSEIGLYNTTEYFWGFLASQILGGWLAFRIGGATMFGTCIGAGSFLTIITPNLGYMSGKYGFDVLRAVTGVFAGMVFPSLQALLARWSPPEETTRLSCIGFIGISLPTMCYPLFSLISEYFAWRWIFYYSGIIGLAWTVLFFIFVKNDPKYDPRITPEELEHLQETITTSTQDASCSWFKILTSKAVWAICLGQFFNDFGFQFYRNQFDGYVYETWKFNLSRMIILTSTIPALAEILFYAIGYFTVDYLRKGSLGTTKVRKIYFCVSSIVIGILMAVAIGYGNLWIALTSFILIYGFKALVFLTLMTNSLDISPSHASTVIGISWTFARLAVPATNFLSTMYLIMSKDVEIRPVFFISGGFYLLGAVLYLIFGSGKLQKWAISTNEEIPMHQIPS